MDVHDGRPGLEGQGHSGIGPEVLGVKGNFPGNGGEKPGLGVLGPGVVEALGDGDGKFPCLHRLPGGKVQALNSGGEQFLGFFAQEVKEAGRGGEVQGEEHGKEALVQDFLTLFLVRDAQACDVKAYLGIVRHGGQQMADGDVETHDTHPLVDHAQRHIAPGHRLFIGAPGLGGGEIGLEGQAVLLLIHIEGIAVLVALALVLVLGELLRQLLQILRRRLGGLVPLNTWRKPLSFHAISASSSSSKGPSR